MKIFIVFRMKDAKFRHRFMKEISRFSNLPNLKIERMFEIPRFFQKLQGQKHGLTLKFLKSFEDKRGEFLGEPKIISKAHWTKVKTSENERRRGAPFCKVVRGNRSAHTNAFLSCEFPATFKIRFGFLLFLESLPLHLPQNQKTHPFQRVVLVKEKIWRRFHEIFYEFSKVYSIFVFLLKNLQNFLTRQC